MNTRHLYVDNLNIFCFVKSFLFVMQKDDHKRAAFLLFFAGEQLRTRVRKICDGFQARVVENCPESPEQRHQLHIATQERLVDMSTVIEKTLEHRDRVLHAASLNLRLWEYQVCKHFGHLSFVSKLVF